jgi:UDP-2-acetamido-3-amino-2,3-dideoxy-glucuronate N-acetyltransferase
MGNNYFKHPLAVVESKEIGDGTKIWAFAHVMPGAKIGANCNIGDHCFVEARAQIGNNVTIKNYVAIWDGVTVEDGVFIGPHAAFTNDMRPRSRNPNWILSETRLGRGATVGANATILCGITIGAFAFVGAGAVVTKNLGPYALACGNPAQTRGYVCQCAEKLVFRAGRASCQKCGRSYRKTRTGVSLLKERT